MASTSINAGSTLADVANQINNTGLYLTASVVSDAAGEHLSITAAGNNAVTVSSDPAIALTQSSVGSDASLNIDGIPVSSASNTVTGAIPGVTLNLQGAAAGTQVVLNVAADTSQISSAVSQFVSDYNAALSAVNTQFTYSSSTQSQGVLGSDGIVRSLQSALLGVGSYTATSSSSSPVTTLAFWAST